MCLFVIIEWEHVSLLVFKIILNGVHNHNIKSAMCWKNDIPELNIVYLIDLNTTMFIIKNGISAQGMVEG